jgi:hypothetical protein
VASTPKPPNPAPTAGPNAPGKKKPSERRVVRGLQRLDADTRAKIVILYQEGVSTPNLAKRYNVPAEWLRKVLYPAMGLKPVMGQRKFEDTK